MSIDYDRLRELLEKHSPAPWTAIGEYDNGKPRPDTSRLMRDADGEYLGIMHPPDAELAALAPEVARELLRLRDGVKALVVEKRMWVDQLCDPYEEVLNPDWLSEVGGEEPIGLALEKVCRQLTDLLDGDTE